jgi:soluble lytic murein transglycosylase-like protein
MFIFIEGCLSTQMDSPIKVEIGPQKYNRQVADDEALQRLERFLEDKSEYAGLMGEYLHYLRATVFEQKGKGEEAEREWLAGLQGKDSFLGEKFLSGWIRTTHASLKEKSSPEIIARLLLAKTQNGQTSLYLKRNRYTDTKSLAKAIEKSLKLSGSDSRESEPLALAQLAQKDRFLNQVVGKYCDMSVKQRDQVHWLDWMAALPDERRFYFQGKVAARLYNDEDAEYFLKKALDIFIKNKQSQDLAIDAMDHLLIVQRRQGKRVEAADWYIKLISMYEQPSVNSQAFGMSQIKFSHKKIDHLLWGARSCALIGDYLNAKNFIQEAFKEISFTQTVTDISPAERSSLIEAHAEGYHILSSRVAVEEKKFEDARHLSQIALELPGLNERWRERFNWNIGLYYYIEKQYDKALSYWEKLLAETNSSQMKPQLLFWIARAKFENNDRGFNDFYERLEKEYPLSFYTLVAPSVAKLPQENLWSDIADRKMDLEGNLNKVKKGHIEEIRAQQSIARSLTRAEILAELGLGQLAEGEIRRLQRQMVKSFPMRNHIEKYIYLSRLYFKAGAFADAISLNETLSRLEEDYWHKHTEQVYMYYPQAFYEVFRQYSFENYLDTQLLMGIAHRESKFNDQARSPAGAQGLMQLMRPTAQKYAAMSQLKIDDLTSALTQPKVNVFLGATYLKSLKSKYKSSYPHMLAAYNSGETSVDQWIKTRNPSEDQLLWIELIPFKETQDYVKKVWANILLYGYLYPGK